MAVDLHDDDALRAVCNTANAEAQGDGHKIKVWRTELGTFLGWVRSANKGERATLEFQKKLWDENPVTNVGMGTVKIDPAIQHPEFRNWVAGVGLEPLPQDLVSRTARLEKIHKEMVDRVAKHTDRVPWLKVLRVMAALFPSNFTTIADRARLRQLHDAICPHQRTTAVPRNVRIMQRLTDVLGPADDNPSALADRMTLPWLVFSSTKSGEEEPTSEPTGTKGDVRLVPLPAPRRRKGLTAIGGRFQRMLAVLQEIEHGKTREDLLDYLKGAYPGSKTSSYRMLINSFMSEFGALIRDGDLYKLTQAGEAVLETGEADPLAEWLLTRTLGVDHVVVELRDKGARSKSELLTLLQSANPGWTATFAPSAIISWLRAMDVVTRTGKGMELTNRGRAWADQVHWKPEFLASESEEDDDPDASTISSVVTEVALPSLGAIQDHIASRGVVLAKSMVRDLHAGLNAHARRHLAILAGLSGTGKTLLARTYAEALVGGEDAARSRVKIIPVQPGWYDPAALLGYPNPVKPDEYVRKDFLDFVFRAVGDPTRPYVVILDEMNLSHPEQYMAPLLSAMESGADVNLHAEGDDLDGVPRGLPYPANLYILGTVNMDETTHGLSDKVLDRAFVLEFWHVDLEAYPHWGSTGLDAAVEKQVRDILESLLTALQPARLHFGWRVVDDVFGFLKHAQTDAPDAVLNAIDAVIYAKVMPKLRGEDSLRFREALRSVGAIATSEKLTRCAAKAEELSHDLETTGSARFWR